jgi:hypothetical protein
MHFVGKSHTALQYHTRTIRNDRHIQPNGIPSCYGGQVEWLLRCSLMVIVIAVHLSSPVDSIRMNLLFLKSAVCLTTGVET